MALASAAATSGSIVPAISLIEKALKHLNRMRAEWNVDICLRIGVKQGGCSGMSYTMEFENRANASPDESVIEYDGFTIVCGPEPSFHVWNGAGLQRRSYRRWWLLIEAQLNLVSNS